MSDIPITDPHGSYYYVLEIDGVEVAHFMEFSGLKSTCEVFEIAEGGFNQQVHQFPGVSKWENITLRYCTQSSIALFEWRESYLEDDFGLRTEPSASGAIVMKDNAGNEVRRFSFQNMWPVSWEGPGLNSGGSELAIETLEVAFDHFYMDGDGSGPEPEEPIEVPDGNPDQIETPPVQFEKDEAVLTEEGHEVIDQVAEELNSRPEVEDVWVEGHTCTLGSWGYNKALSESRSRVVMQELRGKAPGKNYYSRGYSWKYPVAPNATEAGRIQNRRTEFWTSSPESRGLDPSEPDSKPG
jgi:phage tail-like protein